LDVTLSGSPKKELDFRFYHCKQVHFKHLYYFLQCGVLKSHIKSLVVQRKKKLHAWHIVLSKYNSKAYPEAKRWRDGGWRVLGRNSRQERPAVVACYASFHGCKRRSKG